MRRKRAFALSFAVGRLAASLMASARGRAAPRRSAVGEFATRLARIAAATIAISAFSLIANASTPAMKMIAGTPIQPSAAWTYYGSATTHTVSAAAPTVTPPEIVAEARALGAGRLSNTQYTQNVYEYVRDNIAIEFRFGLSKGGLGALIFQSGTAFDQAQLMMALLKQGHVAASYQVGTITLTAQQFGQWTAFVTGLSSTSPNSPSNPSFTVNAQAACQFLADGAIPATINSATTITACSQLSGNLTSVVMGHIWISANGDVYDPAFKVRKLKAANIDVAASAGCGTMSSPTCGSSTDTAAVGSGSGASSGNFITGVPYYQNVNESAVAAKLNGYASGIQTAIQNASLANGQVDDVIGGAEPDLSYSPTIGSSFAYSSSAQYTWSYDSTGAPLNSGPTEIPDQFRSTLRVQYGTCVNYLFYSDETSTRRLVFAESPSTGANGFYIDGQLLSSVSCSAAVVLSVTHPYVGGTYGSDSQTMTFWGAVVQGWGDSSRAGQTFFADIQAGVPSPQGFPCGVSSSSGAPPCADDSPPTFAAQLLAQQTAATQILGQVSSTAVTRHHTLGIVTGSQLQLVDVRGVVSVNSMANDATAKSSAFDSVSLLSSMLEGSLQQQQQDSWQGESAVSLTVLSNRQGYKLLNVSNTAMSSVESSLTNYGSARLPNLTAAAAEGYSFIIPQNGQAGQFSMLNAQVTLGYGPDYGYMAGADALLINEQLKGATEVAASNPLTALQSVRQSDYSVKKKSYASIDLASGAARLTPPPDIVTGVGDFPYSLSMQRSYLSSVSTYFVDTTELECNCGPVGNPVYTDAVQYGGPDASADTYQHYGAFIGNGWTHNWIIQASMNNDALEALGADSGLDASAAIAGIFTLYDLDHAATVTFDRRLTSIFTAYWLSEQFVNNAVTVQIGAKTETFQRLPSGVFNPPLGSASKLTQSGSRAGPYYGLWYSYANVGLTYSDASGSVITFGMAGRTYSGALGGQRQFYATGWTFPTGVSLSFQYTFMPKEISTGLSGTDLIYQYVLTKVSNNLGRSLTFTDSDSNGVWTPITKVTDDSGRYVTYARTGSSASCTIGAVCTTLSVTAPDGGVSTYDTAAGSDSPDPTNPDRVTYHLRRWYTPSDATHPYQIVAYDSLYRAATLTDNLSHQSAYYVSTLGGQEWRKRGEAVDPMGVSTLSYFDPWNSELASIDALGRVHAFAYDGAHRRTLAMNPELDCVLTTFDVRSNPLTSSYYPKTGGCQLNGLVASPVSSLGTPFVTTTTYEEGPMVLVCSNIVICNKPASQTDPRSLTTNYSWNSSTGNLTQILKPADNNGVRPESDFNYTALGGISFLTSKVDKISSSVSTTTTFTYNSSNKYVLSTSAVDSAGLDLCTSYQFDSVGNLLSTTDPRGSGCH